MKQDPEATGEQSQLISGGDQKLATSSSSSSMGSRKKSAIDFVQGEYVYPEHPLVGQQPWYILDNPFIHSGFRPISSNWRTCVRSMLQMHNETCNIYTHALGAVTFAGLLTYTCFGMPWNSYKSSPNDEFRALGWFFPILFIAQAFSGCACFSCSVCFHTMMNQSYEKWLFWVRIDYSGILMILVASVALIVQMVHLCNTNAAVVYWCFLIMFSSITAVIMVTQPGFAAAGAVLVRSGLFSAIGILGLFACIHRSIEAAGTSALHGELVDGGMALYYVMYLLLLVGNFTYSTMMPERFLPGKLDYFNSHALMHLFTFGGALVCWEGSRRYWHYWRDTPCRS